MRWKTEQRKVFLEIMDTASCGLKRGETIDHLSLVFSSAHGMGNYY